MKIDPEDSSQLYIWTSAQLFRIKLGDYSLELLLQIKNYSETAKINRLKFVRHSDRIAMGILTFFPDKYSQNTLTFIPNYS